MPELCDVPLSNDNGIPRPNVVVNELVVLLNELFLSSKSPHRRHPYQRLVKVDVDRRFTDGIDTLHLSDRCDVYPLKMIIN